MKKYLLEDLSLRHLIKKLNLVIVPNREISVIIDHLINIFPSDMQGIYWEKYQGKFDRLDWGFAKDRAKKSSLFFKNSAVGKYKKLLFIIDDFGVIVNSSLATRILDELVRFQELLILGVNEFETNKFTIAIKDFIEFSREQVLTSPNYVGVDYDMIRTSNYPRPDPNLEYEILDSQKVTPDFLEFTATGDNQTLPSRPREWVESKGLEYELDILPSDECKKIMQYFESNFKFDDFTGRILWKKNKLKYIATSIKKWRDNKLSKYLLKIMDNPIKMAIIFDEERGYVGDAEKICRASIDGVIRRNPCLLLKVDKNNKPVLSKKDFIDVFGRYKITYPVS